MIIDDVTDLTYGSSKLVNVECDFKVSDKCRNLYTNVYKDVLRYRTNNDNKDICLFCSRKIKSSGRLNPNTKYKDLDDNFFKTIDTEYKAYLLGWIGSDGNIRKDGFTISINKKDIYILEKLRDIICSSLQIIPIKNNMVKLSVCSSEISKDLCSIFNISAGKKSHVINFPDFEDNEMLMLSFVRGFFDGDGSICNTYRYTPECNITSCSRQFLSGIVDNCGCGGKIVGNSVWWYGNNCLDFLGKIYNNPKIFLPRKRDLYLDWAAWIPTLEHTTSANKIKDISVGKHFYFNWGKTDINAVTPSKTRVTDSGYDLTLIRKIKENGLVEYYDTGIKVSPPFGYYFMLCGRSSISKSGYIMANSIGIIDRTYHGNIIVALQKIDNTKPDLILPVKLVQIIPQPIIHMEMVEVDGFDDTDRNDGGFGSTDK